MEFSELFFFASFGIVRFPKFGIVLEISVFLNSQKKFGNKFGNKWVKNPVFEGFGVKVQKTGSKRGVFEHSKFTENLEFVLFQTFQKSRKNDLKIKVRKS